MTKAEQLYVKKLEEIVNYFFLHEKSIRIDNHKKELFKLKSSIEQEEKEQRVTAVEVLKKHIGGEFQFKTFTSILTKECLNDILQAMHDFRNQGRDENTLTESQFHTIWTESVGKDGYNKK